MSQEQEQPQIKISVHDFFFEKWLYESMTASDFERDIFQWEVDWYSSLNKIDTTYTITQHHNIWFHQWDIKQISHRWMNTYYSSFNGIIEITLHCKRKDEEIVYFILIEDNNVTKIGQHPSLADIQFAELWKTYDKILWEDDLKNFKKAIWIYSHGAGAWSFVYLRRIFENLIFETYHTHKSKLSITESDFITKLRMSEKIDTIKDFLPESLLEMRPIYSILSKWVHELSESECMKYFQALKVSIELILDEKIEMKEKEDKKQKVSLAIQQISSQIQ